MIRGRSRGENSSSPVDLGLNKAEDEADGEQPAVEAPAEA